MTKLSLIARTSLNMLGVSFIVCWLGSLSEVFNRFGSMPYAINYAREKILLLASIHLFLLFVLYYIFIRKSASIWAIPANTGKTQITQLWIQAGLSLGFVFCGVWIIIMYNYSFIEDSVFFLITAPRKIVDMLVMGYIDPMFNKTAGVYISNIINLIEVIFGVYLLLGAPQFVKWQIKKITDESVPDKISDTEES